MEDMTEREKQIERESIEWIFCLTGGELNDAPWVAKDANGQEHSNVYNFDGAPEWLEVNDEYDSGVYYRTVVECNLYGGSAATLTDDEGTWHLVDTYLSSGETQCPCFEDEERGPTHFGCERCEYCECEPGDKHGYIYIGDGWVEALYRRQEYYCDDCNETIEQGVQKCGDCLAERAAEEND